MSFAFESDNNDSQIFKSKASLSQDSIFPEKCLGVWEGMLEIFSKGKFIHRVKIRFTAAKTNTVGTYIWKTEYLSKSRPSVKDYKLVVDTLNEGRYILDEGDGVKLFMYCVNDKLYSMYNVEDIYLTSTRELLGDKLIFEVTSGVETKESKDVRNYSVSNVQRAILTKLE
jgi:hypothetical protein